jgi:dynein intermediate chain 1
MLFDMAIIVVDAVWAPYSSTIFACATIETVYVYDVNVNLSKIQN